MSKCSRYPRAEEGSILLLLSVIVFVFLSASLAFASAQLSHAKRLKAEFARLQAVYAAESGIYAALDATADVPVTTLQSVPGTLVTFQAVKGSDAWFSSTGSALVNGDTYLATARAYTSGGKILMWEIP
ncbi:MAG TPA: hypothetical protein V6D05_03680 [Stenomitos sp.]